MMLTGVSGFEAYVRVCICILYCAAYDTERGRATKITSPPPGQKVTCSAAPAAALLAEKQLRIMLRLLGRLIIGADCENEGFSQIHCYLQLLSILTY